MKREQSIVARALGWVLAVLVGRAIQIALMIAVLVWDYARTGSLRRVMFLAGIMVGWSIVMAIAMRVGEAIHDAMGGSQISRMDHRGMPASIEPVNWKKLELSMIEQMKLFVWMRSHPAPTWPRVVGSVVAGGLIVALVVLGCSGAVPQDVTYVLALGVGVPTLITMRRVVRRGYERWNSEALLATGRCAACAYDLKTLKPDGDGLHTCAECGAAWRLSSD